MASSRSFSWSSCEAVDVTGWRKSHSLATYYNFKLYSTSNPRGKTKTNHLCSLSLIFREHARKKHVTTRETGTSPSAQTSRVMAKIKRTFGGKMAKTRTLSDWSTTTLMKKTGVALDTCNGLLIYSFSLLDSVFLSKI